MMSKDDIIRSQVKKIEQLQDAYDFLRESFDLLEQSERELKQKSEYFRELLQKYLDMTKLAYGTYASEIHNSSIAKLIEETEKALEE